MSNYFPPRIGDDEHAARAITGTHGSPELYARQGVIARVQPPVPDISDEQIAELCLWQEMYYPLMSKSEKGAMHRWMRDLLGQARALLAASVEGSASIADKALMQQALAALIESESELRDTWFDHPVRKDNQATIAALRARLQGATE